MPSQRQTGQPIGNMDKKQHGPSKQQQWQPAIVAAVIVGLFFVIAIKKSGPTGVDKLMSPVKSALARNANAMQQDVPANYRHAYDTVYKHRNYSVCSTQGATAECWLQLATPVDCPQLFRDYVDTLQHHTPVFPAPRKVPAGQEDEFLLEGLVRLLPFYINQQAGYDPKAKPPVFGEASFQKDVARVKARQHMGPYTGLCFGVYQALDCHPIEGSRGAVFGTAMPWLEAILFAYNAKHVTTVEFRKTISELPNHTMLQPLEWAEGWLQGTMQPVDFAFSVSSWEHDGLGRYGDPVDPWGDIKAMQRASCYVKPGGLLYLSAPASYIDQLQYNAHRIYGPVRLPLMTANWEVVGVYTEAYKAEGCGAQTCAGLMDKWAAAAPLHKSAFQPVMVLRNMRTSPCVPLGRV